MVLVDPHDARHEVVVLHLDLHRLGHFVELASRRILAFSHNSYHLAELSVGVDPYGDHGATVLALLPLDEDLHEEVGDPDERGGVLEHPSIFSVIFDVGDAN